jgi:hypothetical protein
MINALLWLCEVHMSYEHFTVDGTLIEAWAGQKSFSAQGRSSTDCASAMRASA